MEVISEKKLPFSFEGVYSMKDYTFYYIANETNELKII